ISNAGVRKVDFCDARVCRVGETNANFTPGFALDVPVRLTELGHIRALVVVFCHLRGVSLLPSQLDLVTGRDIGSNPSGTSEAEARVRRLRINNVNVVFVSVVPPHYSSRYLAINFQAYLAVALTSRRCFKLCNALLKVCAAIPTKVCSLSGYA